MANSSYSEAELQRRGLRRHVRGARPGRLRRLGRHSGSGHHRPAGPGEGARGEPVAVRRAARSQQVPTRCDRRLRRLPGPVRPQGPAVVSSAARPACLYHRALERLVDDLGVASAVELADAVSGPELLAHYRGGRRLRLDVGARGVSSCRSWRRCTSGCRWWSGARRRCRNGRRWGPLAARATPAAATRSWWPPPSTGCSRTRRCGNGWWPLAMRGRSISRRRDVGRRFVDVIRAHGC